MDIYFSPAWGKVNELIEDGECKEFYMECEYGAIRYQFMLRDIPWDVDGKHYYDVASLYGYGGPHIEKCVTGKMDLLIDEYQKAFQEYCAKENIVSEFVRFHPIEENAKIFETIYHPQYLRHTVGTNLSVGEDPVALEFSKSSRKTIRQALKKGVTWKVLENPKDVSDFIRVYYSTMDRDKASDFYYFSEEYFEKCLELMGAQIILVEALYNETVIAAGFYITSDKTIHAHLSGTLNEYLYLSPAYIIKYATAVWGKEHGYDLVHYGGGTTNDPDDSLLQYKMKFTKDTIFDFYVGKKIWNAAIYEELCKMRNIEFNEKDTSEGFFPAYRRGGGTLK